MDRTHRAPVVVLSRDMIEAQVLVLAKAPVPGQVKTRLSPPLTEDQAAAVARAALESTLDAVRRTRVTDRVLVLDGSYEAVGFELQPQVDGPLDERLAAAFDQAWSRRAVPALLIGMDTPQVTDVLLEAALTALLAPRVDAVLGLAEDGGWWALGLRRPHPSLIRGVLTSRPDTGQVQRQRLVDAGLTVLDLPVLRDVDTAPDLPLVAQVTPGGPFVAAVAAVLA